MRQRKTANKRKGREAEAIVWQCEKKKMGGKNGCMR